MKLNDKELTFWNSYLQTLNQKPVDPFVEANMAGNAEIANELLDLYLTGKKTAGSGLLKDYEISGEELPKVGNFWIILDSNNTPKVIMKTVKVEFYEFSKVPEEVAIAEGEGDLSLDYWHKVHTKFFTPFLSEWKIDDLNKETVVTEYFELVYQ